jgi:hypothetical protein
MTNISTKSLPEKNRIKQPVKQLKLKVQFKQDAFKASSHLGELQDLPVSGTEKLTLPRMYQ